jgi:formylglycine-generating enzyme required for sulfatase activity
MNNKLILQSTLFSTFLCTSALLQAEEGILALTTDPPNAEIYVDGQLKANLTPVILLHLPAGKHLIEAKKDNKEAKLEVLISDNVVVHNKIVLVDLPKKPGEIFRDPLKDGSLGPEMVVIPAGEFRMGDIQGTGDSDEKPVHTVTLNSFAMGRHEVTFAEYDYFAQQTGRENPRDEGWGRGNRPVINVSWDDAVAYAEWLSGQTGRQYRLPTEAGWEYAARAGTETDYWWGNDIGINRANCNGCGSQWDNMMTAPVCSFSVNAFGLCDTVGNVCEWTCSAYEVRYNGEELKCTCQGDSYCPRVWRGGAWSLTARWLRASHRNWNTPATWDSGVGFRLAAKM